MYLYFFQKGNIAIGDGVTLIIRYYSITSHPLSPAIAIVGFSGLGCVIGQHSRPKAVGPTQLFE
jgi:hypothetical protein